MITTEEIISLIRRRDEKGISLLYDRYADPLYGMISHMLADDGLAEDVLQRTMLKVWNSIEGFDASKASLFTWMSTIARNTALDQKRLRSYQDRQKTISTEEIVYRPAVRTPEGVSMDVANLLQGLEDSQRLVLEYAYLKGYTQQEISDELGWPLGTVKTRLRAAIGVLREQLRHEKKYFLGHSGLPSLILMIRWV